MNKHTPGPWSVGEDGDMIWASDLDHSPVLVANVPFTRDPRVEADARLIAAAPELLEALQMVEDAYRDHLSETGEHSIPYSPLAKIRAAIAKATGEAQ